MNPSPVISALRKVLIYFSSSESYLMLSGYFASSRFRKSELKATECCAVTNLVFGLSSHLIQTSYAQKPPQCFLFLEGKGSLFIIITMQVRCRYVPTCSGGYRSVSFVPWSLSDTLKKYIMQTVPRKSLKSTSMFLFHKAAVL